jgi:hypothetical protein
VVIQATPHTETAPVSAQSPQDFPADHQKTAKAEKNGLGVFAKILAGLSRKIGTEQAAGKAVSGVSPGETAETGELGPNFVGKTKNSLLKNVSLSAIDKTGTGKAAKTGARTEELAESELSEQEKNILLSLGGLVNRNEVQVAGENSRSLEKTGRLPAEEAGRAASKIITPEETGGNALKGLQPEGTVVSAAANRETVSETGQKSK